MNRHGNNSNALLVEIMIAVLFFALCATVVLDGFIKAHDGTIQCAATTDAMADARNILERLSVSEDPQALLAQTGYTETEDAEGPVWQYQKEETYRLTVRLLDEPTEAGTLRLMQVGAWSAADDTPLIRLKSARYEPAEVE